MAGELTTTNYGWVKPTVGSSTDAWGGYLNTDLDGIDSTVKSVSNAIPLASSTTPAMDGTATIGTGTTFARADHIHPVDTSRYAVSNPLGYQTAAQVTAAVPVASSTTPLMNGVAAVGAGTTWARADHVHPTDTSIVGGINDNRIVNGDMRIDQRNGGASGSASGYTVDRWRMDQSVAAKMSWGRNLVSAGPPAFPYSLGAQGGGTTYALLAGDYFVISQAIEADMISDFAWGTASAQPVTLSFWAQSNVTGAFGGSVRNAASTRSYPFTFSIPVASSWTRIVITIPGDTAGTWVTSGAASSITVSFSCGTGATFSGPAGAWAATNYISAAGAVNVLSLAFGALSITGVKLEIGSVATPYNRQSLAKSLADCQRYYQMFIGAMLASGYASTANAAYSLLSFPVTMRSQPTAVYTGIAYTNASNLVAQAVTVDRIINQITIAATGVGYVGAGLTLSAEL